MLFCKRLVKLTIQFLFAPFEGLTRLWQRDDFGRQFMVVIIEIMVLVHLVMVLFRGLTHT